MFPSLSSLCLLLNSSPFKDAKHDATDLYFDQYHGMNYASNQMDWILKKGQELPTSPKIHGSSEQEWIFRWDRPRNVTECVSSHASTLNVPMRTLELLKVFTQSTMPCIVSTSYVDALPIVITALSIISLVNQHTVHQANKWKEVEKTGNSLLSFFILGCRDCGLATLLR